MGNPTYADSAKKMFETFWSPVLSEDNLSVVQVKTNAWKDGVRLNAGVLSPNLFEEGAIPSDHKASTIQDPRLPDLPQGGLSHSVPHPPLREASRPLPPALRESTFKRTPRLRSLHLNLRSRNAQGTRPGGLQENAPSNFAPRNQRGGSPDAQYGLPKRAEPSRFQPLTRKSCIPHRLDL